MPKKKTVDQYTLTDKPYRFRNQKKFYNQNFNRSRPYPKFSQYRLHSGPQTNFNPYRFETYHANSFYNQYQNQPFYNSYNGYNYYNKPWYKNRWNNMAYMLQDHQFKMMLFHEYYLFTKFLDFYRYNMGY